MQMILIANLQQPNGTSAYSTNAQSTEYPNLGSKVRMGRCRLNGNTQMKQARHIL